MHKHIYRYIVGLRLFSAVRDFRLSVLFAGIFAFLAAPSAFAKTVGSGTAIAQSSFDSFANTVLGWMAGGLGIGLALTCMIIGAGAGLIRSSPLPAIGGVALAAFFAWGPGIIVEMVQSGSGSLF